MASRSRRRCRQFEDVQGGVWCVCGFSCGSFAVLHQSLALDIILDVIVRYMAIFVSLDQGSNPVLFSF